MAYTLYELQAGSIRRKVTEDDGTVVSKSFKAGYAFVPSPAEYAANKDRLKPLTNVEGDHPEVKNAILNTNLKDHPNFGKSGVKDAQTNEDIRNVKDTAHAIALAKAASDETTLEKYAIQESENKPRVRKVVLKAIEERREELKKTKNLTSDAALGGGVKSE